MSTPPETPLGPKVLDELAAAMQIDDEWSLREPRSLVWWPHQLPQTLAAGEPFESEGLTLTPITVSTPLVSQVADTPDVHTMLATLNAQVIQSALVYDDADHTIRLTSTVYIHEQSYNTLMYLLKHIAVLQICRADSLSTFLRASLAATDGQENLAPFAMSHPSSGSRPEPDDMLNIADQMYRPIGQKPSRFAGLEAQSVRTLPLFEGLTQTEVAGGFQVHIPFGSEHALLEFNHDAAHPFVGNGALLLLTLPIAVEDARILNEMNRREGTRGEGFHQAGAWCQSPRGHTTHATFLPSAMGVPGMLEQQLGYGLVRALFWSEELG